MEDSFVLDNSCNGSRSCTLLNAKISSGSCNCDNCCTCTRPGETIAENTCNTPGECCTVGGGTFDIGTITCINGVNVCLGAKGNMGHGSCQGDEACSFTNLQVGDNSCKGASACSYNDPYSDGKMGTVGSNSCTGEKACYYRSDLSVGDNSCNGAESCIGLTYSPYNWFIGLTVGSNSCNCDGCCSCLPSNSVVGDWQCNTPGECC